MSFDVFIQDIPETAATVADIPDDFRPKPIGKRSDIIGAILKSAPGADFSKPTWGVIATDDYSIEVNIGEADPVESFAFHVRGGFAAFELIDTILRSLSLRAFAPTDTGIFNLHDLRTAFGVWTTYRDQIAGDSIDT